MRVESGRSGPTQNVNADISTQVAHIGPILEFKDGSGSHTPHLLASSFCYFANARRGDLAKLVLDPRYLGSPISLKHSAFWAFEVVSRDNRRKPEWITSSSCPLPFEKSSTKSGHQPQKNQIMSLFNEKWRRRSPYKLRSRALNL